MSETKPEKRLVSKGRYLWVMGRKYLLEKLGLLTGNVGYIVFPMSILVISVIHKELSPLLWGSWLAALVVLFACVFLPALGIMGIMYASGCAGEFLTQKGNAIEPVQLITNHNAYLLPIEETLVRGSHLPPTIQQAELLRAAQSGQETPQEQLLRATNGESNPQ